MTIDIPVLLAALFENLSEFFADSLFVLALKFFLFVYVMVLIVDVILLLVLRGVSSDIKKSIFGIDRPLIPRNTFIVRWEKILARLESDNPSQYKVALLEADQLADEILGGMNFKGETMAEKLEKVQGAQLENKEALALAHQVRNQIIHERDFMVSREEAKRWLDMYKKFFDEMELL